METMPVNLRRQVSMPSCARQGGASLRALPLLPPAAHEDPSARRTGRPPKSNGNHVASADLCGRQTGLSRVSDLRAVGMGTRDGEYWQPPVAKQAASGSNHPIGPATGGHGRSQVINIRVGREGGEPAREVSIGGASLMRT